MITLIRNTETSPTWTRPVIEDRAALIIETFTNGFGDWRARVHFSHTLSESDTRPEFNLNAQWARIRRAARAAIVHEVAEREQKTWETLAMAERRIRETLGKLDVIDQHIHAGGNTWDGVTIGEYVERNASGWQA